MFFFSVAVYMIHVISRVCATITQIWCNVTVLTAIINTRGYVIVITSKDQYRLLYSVSNITSVKINTMQT